MAQRASSFLTILLISSILLVTAWQAVAGRSSIAKSSNTEDMKEPEWLFKSDGRVHIPDIGHVGFPPKFGLTPNNPFTGGTGTGGTGAGTGSGSRSGSSGGSYIPGGDDTFVPNPGFELPIPGSGGRVPPALHP